MADPLATRFQGLPDILYGTAFKFENSGTLTEKALKAGFRAIDTAGGKPQYEEKLVGDGIAAALAAGVCKREQLYVSPYVPHTVRFEASDTVDHARSKPNSPPSKQTKTPPTTPTTQRNPSQSR